jgi:predicted DCC family thiol-disulfide oxidoreductase YuxK
VRPVSYPVTVFYDASSVAFTSKVDALKGLAHEGRLRFVDCSAADFDETVLAGMGITRADLMARIHARDAHGRWYTGLAAMEAAHRALY